MKTKLKMVKQKQTQQAPQSGEGFRRVAVFFTLFFSVAYFLLTSWRHKIRSHTPLHILLLVASFVYLLAFFGIAFVQTPTTTTTTIKTSLIHDEQQLATHIATKPSGSEEDDEIVNAVVAGAIPSYSLESKLGDCKRAAVIRREALQSDREVFGGFTLGGF